MTIEFQSPIDYVALMKECHADEVSLVMGGVFDLDPTPPQKPHAERPAWTDEEIEEYDDD